ncbi:hypothetical protein GCM10022278_13360 [Allohahella marinimesophila]|uniref:Uncharacterized protein n=1 Tax=Allohahella marinimesophila TaxID=1054972 RepID=A0ABP7NYJ5_9GAMM
MRLYAEVGGVIEGSFETAWPEYFDLVADVEWTQPVPHALLFEDGVQADRTAYFYSIVARVKQHWWPFYIGMVFYQYASVRNQQPDHRDRLLKLQNSNPGLTFVVA